MFYQILSTTYNSLQKMKTSQANMYVDINGAWRVVEGVQLRQILVIMKVGHKQLTAKKNTLVVYMMQGCH